MSLKNILSKAGAVLAVVMVLALSCVTAFADVTVDYSTPGTYELEFSGGNNSNPGVVVSSGTAVEGYTYTVTFAGSFAASGSGEIQISADGGSTWQSVAQVVGSDIDGSATISYLATDDYDIRIQAPRIGVYDPYTVTVVVSAPAPLGDVLDVVDGMTTGMFSLGTSLLTWITSPGNAIALIAVGLFILVALVGGIRKLIPGV